MLEKPILFGQNDEIMTKSISRYTEFQIIFNHLLQNNAREFNALNLLRESAEIIFKSYGVSDYELKRYKLISSTFDILQCNFAYDRCLPPQNEKETSRYNEILNIQSIIIYSPVFNGVIENLNHYTKHLYWIRIADIFNAPTPEKYYDLYLSIKNNIKNLKDKNNWKERKEWLDYKEWDEIPISEYVKLNDFDDYKRFLFYHVKLKPGVFYIYPQFQSLYDTHENIAISFHRNTDHKDMIDAFNEFSHYFDCYQKYFFSKEENIEIEELNIYKSIINRSEKKASPVKQANSHTYAILALIVWKELNINKNNEDEIFSRDIFSDFNYYKKRSIKEHIDRLNAKFKEWGDYYKLMTEQHSKNFVENSEKSDTPATNSRKRKSKALTKNFKISSILVKTNQQLCYVAKKEFTPLYFQYRTNQELIFFK